MKYRKSTIIIMLISIVMFIISILFLFTNFFSNIFISPKELDYRELDNKLISVQNETTDYINSFNNIGSNIVN